MYVHRRHDLSGSTELYFEYWLAEYADLDAAHIREAAERGSCTAYQKEYIRKDGTRVPILCGYALLEDSADEYIGIVLDLSEQKRAERELREREERFRLLAESLPQLIWMTDTVGENIYCNRRFRDYSGLSEAEMMGIAWKDLIHPEDLAHTLKIWTGCLETGEPYLNEYRLRRKDGVYRHFLARGSIAECGRRGRALDRKLDGHSRSEAGRGCAAQVGKAGDGRTACRQHSA